jgi:predicted MFS family arabinose efflux permease
LLTRLTQAGPDAVGLVFAIYGVFGFVGNVIATRLVDSWGSYRTSLLFMGVLLAGAGIWAIGAGNFAVMAAAVAVWGLGFASTNSMQQVRLIGAAPALGTASVSLNTSALYIGQAIGSAAGGMLFARDLLHGAGYVSVAFIALALFVVTLTKPRQVVALST